MNKKPSTLTTIIIGVVVMAVSAGLFFLLTESDLRAEIHWWSFATILFAELVATAGIAAAGIAAAERGVNRTMLIAGAYTALLLYGAASVLCSVFFLWRMGSFRWLIGIELVLFAMAVVYLVLLITGARRTAQGVEGTMYAVATLDALTGRARELADRHAGTPLGDDLNRVHEALRFSDHSLVVASDQVLFGRFDELETILREGADPQTVQERVAAIESLVQQRSLQVRQGKLGSI